MAFFQHLSKQVLAAFVVSYVGLTAVHASDDEQLYGPPLPDDAAFVRTLGGDASSLADVFGTTLTADGNYTVILADTTDGIERGQYVTVLPNVTIVHEPQIDKAKVQIALVNAGYPALVSLKTADGKVEITTAPTGGAGFREVNPLVLSVAIFEGESMVGDPFEMQLRRDENPTVLVALDGSSTVQTSRVIWDE